MARWVLGADVGSTEVLVRVDDRETVDTGRDIRLVVRAASAPNSLRADLAEALFPG